MREETEELLKKAPLFEKLSPAELRLVSGIGGKKSFARERMIFLEGDQFAGFYIILEGSVKVFKLSAGGDETILHILRPYKSFAETPLFTNSDAYPACAQTMEDSILYYVPKVEFRRLMEDSPSLAIKISEAFATRLMELNKKVAQLSVNVEKRLALYILNEVNLNGSIGTAKPAFSLNVSKKDLAGQLGVAIETLSRNLRKLKDRKIVREVRGEITVLDLRELRKVAE